MGGSAVLLRTYISYHDPFLHCLALGIVFFMLPYDVLSLYFIRGIVILRSCINNSAEGNIALRDSGLMESKSSCLGDVGYNARYAYVAQVEAVVPCLPPLETSQQ